MIPGVGFAEFMVLAIVALLVVGPRDLPRLMRQVGSVIARAKGLAREFQDSFNEMGRELEIEELRKEIQDLKRMEPLEEVKQTINETESETRAAMRGD